MSSDMNPISKLPSCSYSSAVKNKDAASKESIFNLSLDDIWGFKIDGIEFRLAGTILCVDNNPCNDKALIEFYKNGKSVKIAGLKKGDTFKIEDKDKTYTYKIITIGNNFIKIRGETPPSKTLIKTTPDTNALLDEKLSVLPEDKSYINKEKIKNDIKYYCQGEEDSITIETNYVFGDFVLAYAIFDKSGYPIGNSPLAESMSVYMQKERTDGRGYESEWEEVELPEGTTMCFHDKSSPEDGGTAYFNDKNGNSIGGQFRLYLD